MCNFFKIKMSKSSRLNLIVALIVTLGTMGFFDFANATVISNIGTGKSCSTVCLENNTKGCTSIGTDASASNKYINTYINGKLFSQSTKTYSCSDVMTSSKVTPFTVQSLGTNCQCTPNIPTPILQSLAINGDLELTLFWGINGDATPITNYEIYRGMSSGAETFLKEVGKISSYIDYGLTNNTKYYYKVAAKTKDGIGEQSNEQSATAITYCTGVSTCTSWGTCTNGTQTCNPGGYSLIPAGCSAGSVLAPTQSCVPACTSFTYSDWSSCSNGTQTRTILSSVPSNCSGGVTPILSQSCTLSCVAGDPDTCTSWSSCTSGIQTCTGTYTSIPSGCTGSVSVPVRSCAVSQAAFSYGVYADRNTGNLSGYAWSDNIGWIKFGGLSSFPTGSGTSPQNAQLNSSNKLIGWARACAGTVNGDCSTMESRTDGWDGWISLAGTSVDGQYSYGVSLSGTDFSGYAWGSDAVGWIDFTGVHLSEAPIVPITISLSAASSSISSGDSTMITWSSAGADTCTTTENSSFFTSGTSGSKSSGALTGTTDFVTQCINSNNSATKSISVNVTTPPPLPNTPKGGGNECTGTDCEIVWQDDCALLEGQNLEGSYTLSCTDPGSPLGPDNPKPINIPATQMSTCSAKQGTSTDIYVNRDTTWTMTNSLGSISRTKWKGSNISGTASSDKSSYSKVYTTVGPKTISSAAVVTRSSDGTTFISACSASTTVKYVGTTGQI